MSNRLLLGVGPSPYGGSFVGDNLLLEDGDNFLLEDGDQLYLENEAFDPVYDSDAQAYMTAVENADGQELESGVKEAINTFVLGCKSDGIWDAIKASCILAGARTLSGAIQPLVGAAPTNYNFVSGDYNRKTGLVGDGSTKYLLMNRSATDQAQNDRHLYTYVTTIGSDGKMAGCSTSGYVDYIWRAFGNWLYTACATAQDLVSTSFAFANGGYGVARNTSTSYERILKSEISTANNVSFPLQASRPYGVFAAGNGDSKSNHKIAFYSAGDYLSLSALDSRVSTLISQIGAAIP
jgi:hypothetical protein